MMESYEIGKDIQSLKERIDRLEKMSSCYVNLDKPFEESTERSLSQGARQFAEEEIKTKTGILAAKTFTIDRHKHAANGESREGYITITSGGYYQGKVNFRCNCGPVFCACNFDRARIEFRNSDNKTILSVYFQPSAFGLGKASDEDIHCSGWHRLIAESYDRIVYADPMFRSN